MRSARQYKASGDGHFDIVIRPTMSAEREPVDYQQHRVPSIVDDDFDPDDPSKWDKLPRLALPSNWDPAGGDEVEPAPEHPFKHFVLTPAVVLLQESQKRDLKTAFDLLDPLGTGLMETDDVVVVIEALNLNIPPRELWKSIKAVEPQHTGKLCFSEFLQFFETELSKPESRADITGSFHFFDLDGTGKISPENLRQVADAMGDYMDEAEAVDMIAGADRDGDGLVNFDEFRKVIQRTTIVPPRPKKSTYYTPKQKNL